MAATVKTIAAVGIALGTGIAATSAFLPGDAPAPAIRKAEALPSGAKARTRVAEAASDRTAGTWVDPVHKPKPTAPAAASAPEAKPSPSSEAAAAEAPGRDDPPGEMAHAPLPPTRPARLDAAEERTATRKAARPAHPTALARRNEGHRQAPRYAWGYRTVDPYESGYRPAGYPVRGYGYGDVYAYAGDGYPDRGWRAQAEPRAVRRYRGYDADWPSEPGSPY